MGYVFGWSCSSPVLLLVHAFSFLASDFATERDLVVTLASWCCPSPPVLKPGNQKKNLAHNPLPGRTATGGQKQQQQQ
uniref:Putative secreted protein n=1 Tax=Anopheles triannulatus TaxID=58253 RepID=A0A2M4B1Q5_9DIPT